MKITDRGSDILLTGTTDFNLNKTFQCGQCFRWNAGDCGGYTGVAYNRVLRLRQDGDNIILSCPLTDFKNIWYNYFGLGHDYAQIRSRLCISDFMKSAADFGAGIRILRQEPWETLCSFILSQNNNIPRIRKHIDTLCRLYGNQINYCGTVFYAFPDAGTLSKLSENELAPLRCGYRAKYILSAAKAVAGGLLDLGGLSLLSMPEAKKALKQLCGVGDKVADCVLLFGLNMTDSFPVDVWMERALRQYFDPGFDPSVFSPYAGIAQQYIFYYVRNTGSNANK